MWLWMWLSWLEEKMEKLWNLFTKHSGKWQAITMMVMLVLICIYAWT